ncbi:response regulator transcription factor [Streptomyces sp. NPDC090306]|uniref:response regulator transcription factor n=1 Tax=unclassified Streptomyces TaxID=2593676 RepID=UPI0036E11D22
MEPHIGEAPGDDVSVASGGDQRDSGPSEGWRVLVVESAEGEADTLIRGLSRNGHGVARVGTGAKALSAFEDKDMVLVNLELPDLDGLEFCRKVRAVCDVPIIAVTAQGSELDCVLALQAGADDFLAKPYGFRELMARMDAVMRRLRRQEQPVARTISQGQLRVDASTRQVHVADRLVEVTRKEFDLLYHLALHRDTVVSRKELMERVWQDTWSRRTVDTHISSLRGKLGSADWIVTVRGVGFRLGDV